MGVGEIRYKKMFGEYMIYVNGKPILLVCDNTMFVKILPCLDETMLEANKGFPYDGAKEHYILDIDNAKFSKEVIAILEQVTSCKVSGGLCVTKAKDCLATTLR